jgi:mono/diheme cytochrome c family protein
MRTFLALLSTAWMMGGWLSPARVWAAEPLPAAEAAEFFETQVRPVLAENCFRCHGANKQKSGLRLDSLAAMTKGGENGPAVVPGRPDKSKLIQAIRYDGPVQMPPKGKLSPKAIDALTTWVRMGAPWPAGSASAAAKSARWAPGDVHPGAWTSQEVEAIRRSHWAYQPVNKPALPAVKDRSWSLTPLDTFILTRLEEKGLTPAPPADRRTLLRRATFDLIGLPPTAEEIAAFESDPSPDAFAKVVDRLVASPRYGERWGRHWLDVARYADSKGYVYYGERRYPFSYTYRDWVIRAFDEDLPYDQFILQQLAADQLPRGDDPSSLAALGFLTVGRRFAGIVYDILDDRIDVVMRGLQGVTTSCARCHDHKFDPIPTRDYYSLYGVFAGSLVEKQVPLTRPAPTPEYRAYKKEIDRREQEVARFRETKHAELLQRLRGQTVEYLTAVLEVDKLPGGEVYVTMGPGEINPAVVRRWDRFLTETGKGHHPIFAPWHAFAALPPDEFSSRAPAVAEKFAANADPRYPINPLVARCFQGEAPTSMREVARRYGRLLLDIDQQWCAFIKDKPRGEMPAALPDPDREALRQVLYAPGAPPNLPFMAGRLGEIEWFFDEPTRIVLYKLQEKVDTFNVESPAAPPHALIVEDAAEQTNPRVFLRGNPDKPGPEVPRQFLEVLAGRGRQPFRHGSGRLELAQAIASKDNPLTARVMVNRIWQHHFGAALVHTPSDFGLRGEPPTHPQLLDYLAWRFMEDGWSVKRLHRLIMLSRVYQQSSIEDPRYRQKNREADADNRLLWKFNRQRLDWEALRDALLAVSGKLDSTMGGRPVNVVGKPYSPRRTVYAFIDRMNLPGLMRTFDFPNPDLTSPRRFTTTVPQQALFLMNNPFLLEQCRRLAQRTSGTRKPAERIQQLYRLIYGRAPTTGERVSAEEFLSEVRPTDTTGGKPSAGSREPALTPWEQYIQVLLLANEFVFID